MKQMVGKKWDILARRRSGNLLGEKQSNYGYARGAIMQDHADPRHLDAVLKRFLSSQAFEHDHDPCNDHHFLATSAESFVVFA